MIPLGLLGFAGIYAYRQYDQMRSKPEVAVGLVQMMTSGEAAKLLSAKGYLKSRYQANIGTRTPGRVAKMHVEEGSKVKKGDILAELEHKDLERHARLPQGPDPANSRRSCKRHSSIRSRSSAKPRAPRTFTGAK